jgi:hypothetical protein
VALLGRGDPVQAHRVAGLSGRTARGGDQPCSSAAVGAIRYTL